MAGAEQARTFPKHTHGLLAGSERWKKPGEGQ